MPRGVPKGKMKLSDEERKAQKKEYSQRPEVKAKAKERGQRPEVKAQGKEYRDRPENKARKKELDERPEYKARKKEKSQTPEYKARKKELRDRPENKAKRQSSEYKAHQREIANRPENKAKAKERRDRPENKAKAKERGQRPENKAKVKDTASEKRLKILLTYSKRLSNSNVPCCACCKMSGHVDFLALDHIAGREEMDSEPELVKLGYSSKLKNKKLRNWLIENNFPKGFQILCHSCNYAKFNSNINTCPHETARKEETFAMMEEQSSFEV